MEFSVASQGNNIYQYKNIKKKLLNCYTNINLFNSVL